MPQESHPEVKLRNAQINCKTPKTLQYIYVRPYGQSILNVKRHGSRISVRVEKFVWKCCQGEASLHTQSLQSYI